MGACKNCGKELMSHYGRYCYTSVKDDGNLQEDDSIFEESLDEATIKHTPEPLSSLEAVNPAAMMEQLQQERSMMHVLTTEDVNRMVAAAELAGYDKGYAAGEMFSVKHIAIATFVVVVSCVITILLCC